MMSSLRKCHDESLKWYFKEDIAACEWKELEALGEL